MPELPEVETIRHDLEREVVGKRIKSVTVTGSRSVRRLYRALVETLHEAIKLRGSTLSDAQYVDLYGKPGSYQGEHRVYARDGLACSRCRAVVVRHKYSSRSTFLCEACQV